MAMDRVNGNLELVKALENGGQETYLMPMEEFDVNRVASIAQELVDDMNDTKIEDRSFFEKWEVEDDDESPELDPDPDQLPPPLSPDSLSCGDLNLKDTNPTTLELYRPPPPLSPTSLSPEDVNLEDDSTKLDLDRPPPTASLTSLSLEYVDDFLSQYEDVSDPNPNVAIQVSPTGNPTRSLAGSPMIVEAGLNRPSSTPPRPLTSGTLPPPEEEQRPMKKSPMELLDDLQILGFGTTARAPATMKPVTVLLRPVGSYVIMTSQIVGHNRAILEQPPPGTQTGFEKRGVKRSISPDPPATSELSSGGKKKPRLVKRTPFVNGQPVCMREMTREKVEGMDRNARRHFKDSCSEFFLLQLLLLLPKLSPCDWHDCLNLFGDYWRTFFPDPFYEVFSKIHDGAEDGSVHNDVSSSVSIFGTSSLNYFYPEKLPKKSRVNSATKHLPGQKRVPAPELHALRAEDLNPLGSSPSITFRRAHSVKLLEQTLRELRTYTLSCQNVLIGTFNRHWTWFYPRVISIVQDSVNANPLDEEHL